MALITESAEPTNALHTLRRTLDALAPAGPDFATRPILDAFNWSEALDGIGSLDWHLVVFRSVRRPDADMDLLTEYDDLAHEEASRAAGFLHYFKGCATEEGSCLSFCLWQDSVQAHLAGMRPQHRIAMSITVAMYESYRLERYRLVRRGAHSPLRAVELPPPWRRYAPPPALPVLEDLPPGMSSMPELSMVAAALATGGGSLLPAM